MSRWTHLLCNMRAHTIDVRQSTGRILYCTIFRAGGKKLLAKGHTISDEDAKMLETEGMNEVWVTELEQGEVGEDEAVMMVATEIGCGVWKLISGENSMPQGASQSPNALKRWRSFRSEKP